MSTFRNKSSSERVQVMKRLMTKLEKEQANEDTPQVDVHSLLRMLRQVVDHLVKLEEEWQPVDEIEEVLDD